LGSRLALDGSILLILLVFWPFEGIHFDDPVAVVAAAFVVIVDSVVEAESSAVSSFLLLADSRWYAPGYNWCCF
jgi:hypothetical protein